VLVLSWNNLWPDGKVITATSGQKQQQLDEKSTKIHRQPQKSSPKK
jgi:hypothetical protein